MPSAPSMWSWRGTGAHGRSKSPNMHGGSSSTSARPSPWKSWPRRMWIESQCESSPRTGPPLGGMAESTGGCAGELYRLLEMEMTSCGEVLLLQLLKDKSTNELAWISSHGRVKPRDRSGGGFELRASATCLQSEGRGHFRTAGGMAQ